MKRLDNGTWEINDAEMNWFLILFAKASERFKEIDCPQLAKDADKTFSGIYDIMFETGFYGND